MNKKIEKPNYTQTPNILFDEIMRDLNGAELKVILAVIRKTFGWHKERDRISLTQLEEMTGLSRQGILNAIHGKKKEKSVIGGLVNKGYIKIIETKQGNVYELVVNEVDQQETASQLSRLEVVNKVDQESGLASQQSRHTKESILNKLDKETITQQPLIPNLSSKLITKETSKSHDSVMQEEKRREEKKEDAPDKPAKSPKQKHGEYKHVLLTSDEYLRLCEEWGEPELLRMIKELDEGIELKGYKYKNHNLALRKWKSNEKTQRGGYSKPLPVQTRTTFLDMED